MTWTFNLNWKGGAGRRFGSWSVGALCASRRDVHRRSTGEACGPSRLSISRAVAVAVAACVPAPFAHAQLIVSDPLHTVETKMGWVAQAKGMYDAYVSAEARLTQLRAMLAGQSGKREMVDAFLRSFVDSFSRSAGIGSYQYRAPAPTIRLAATDGYAAQQWQGALERLARDRLDTQATIAQHAERQRQVKDVAIQAALSEDVMAIEKAQALIASHRSQLAEFQIQLAANERASALDARAAEMQQVADMYGRPAVARPAIQFAPLPAGPWRR